VACVFDLFFSPLQLLTGPPFELMVNSRLFRFFSYPQISLFHAQSFAFVSHLTITFNSLSMRPTAKHALLPTFTPLFSSRKLELHLSEETEVILQEKPHFLSAINL
jgi:hypothetical protein